MRLLRVPMYALASLVVFVLATSLTINLLLKEEGNLPCPDIAGLDLQEAKGVVEQKGLSLLVVKYEKKRDIPYNRVVSQQPEPAMPVKKGRGVSVVLSDGPKPVTIPNVIGQSLTEAETVLREHAFTIKKILYVPSTYEGRILAQVPSSGENVLDEDGMVLIAGGREKPYYVMPEISTTNDCTTAIDEMRKKRINYTLTYEDPFERAGQGRLRITIPPRTIFNDDDVLEIRMNGGG
jgi:beta-lactam-binding protein with PASTA domain